MHETYLDKFFLGETLAASRLMSIVERGGPDAEAVLDALFPRTGRAYRIGVTGLAGAGKSTLVNHLIRRYRRQGLTVGVVAEDPTSPFSGGAVLGDRLRMIDSQGDTGVFIRSIASRGSETGFSEKAGELADVLDAFGLDIVLLETIGIGQLEYKIRFAAHTTVVVLTPDAGDDVQSLKSGLMEIADVFAVNKADRPGGSDYSKDLESMIALRSRGDGWDPPVVATVGTTGEGVDGLVAAVGSHRDYLARKGLMDEKRREALRTRVEALAEQKLREMLRQNEYSKGHIDAVLGEVAAGRKSPYQAASEIVRAVIAAGGDGPRKSRFNP
jgi:LAO/AO transport system kinase